MRLLPLLFASLVYSLTFYSTTSLSEAKQVSITHNGLELVGYHSVSDPDAPTVLIVHGTLSHAKGDTPLSLQESFADEDINTLAINLSFDINKRVQPLDCSKANKHSHTHQDAIGEIRAWINYLTLKTNNILLLGHSRGGNQVAQYALKYPKSIKSLILMAPAEYDYKKAVKGYQKDHNKNLTAELKKAKQTDSKVWLTLPFLYCGETQVTAESFISYYQDNPQRSTISLLEKLTMPVQFFIASEDKVVPNLSNKISQQKLPDNISVITIDEADHFFRDLYASEVVEHVIENF